MRPPLHKSTACIEIIHGENDCHGFHTSQLLRYRLAENEGGKDAPPEKLTIAFATADMTLTGWRLERIADDLRDGDFLAVRSLPARYANLDKSKCAVASITVEPVAKD